MVLLTPSTPILAKLSTNELSSLYIWFIVQSKRLSSNDRALSKRLLSSQFGIILVSIVLIIMAESPSISNLDIFNFLHRFNPSIRANISAVLLVHCPKCMDLEPMQLPLSKCIIQPAHANPGFPQCSIEVEFIPPIHRGLPFACFPHNNFIYAFLPDEGRDLNSIPLLYDKVIPVYK